MTIDKHQLFEEYMRRRRGAFPRAFTEIIPFELGAVIPSTNNGQESLIGRMNKLLELRFSSLVGLIGKLLSPYDPESGRLART